MTTNTETFTLPETFLSAAIILGRAIADKDYAKQDACWEALRLHSDEWNEEVVEEEGHDWGYYDGYYDRPNHGGDWGPDA